MMLRLADGKTSAIGYRETAPAAATREVFIGPDERVLAELIRVG